MSQKKYLYLLLMVLSIPVLWALNGSYTYGLGMFYRSGVAQSSTLYSAVSLVALLLLSPVIVFARNAYRKAKGKRPDLSYSTSLMVILIGVVVGLFVVTPGMSKWQLHREDGQLRALYLSVRTATTQAQLEQALKQHRPVRAFEVNPSHRIRDENYIRKNNLTLTEGVAFMRLSYPSGNAFSPRRTHIFVSLDEASEKVLAMCFARDDMLECE